MTTYQEFLKQKEKTHIKTGFEVDESQLNKILFDFQKYQIRSNIVALAGNVTMLCEEGDLLHFAWHTYKS